VLTTTSLFDLDSDIDIDATTGGRTGTWVHDALAAFAWWLCTLRQLLLRPLSLLLILGAGGVKFGGSSPTLGRFCL
jgi:hypothetical protein